MIQSDNVKCGHTEQLDIVIVDDDQLTLDIVSWVLGKTQTPHRLFSNPLNAMNYLCMDMPRILVVDYYMPTQNGIDFLAQLKGSIGNTDCSFYLCSSIFPDKDNLNQIEGLGVQILEKSILCNQAELNELLDSRQRVTGY